MRWYVYIAYFFAGAFLANAVPHFTNGVSGRPFPSPFSSPPGQGESGAVVNVLWGTFNLAVGYLLLARVGRFDVRRPLHVLLFAAGWLLMSIMLANAFGALYGGA
ncbi:MAG: hypothetical protein AB7F99_16495 [Vicinamibacterales bacterium]